MCRITATAWRILTRVVGSVLAFQEHVAQGKPFPKLKWTYDGNPNSLRLTIESDLKPKSVVAWTATSKSRFPRIEMELTAGPFGKRQIPR